MAEFKLGRLRFVWKNAWTSTTEYVKDDVVRYGGKSYVCIAAHTSGAASGGFETDLAASRWQLMNDGQAWSSTWTTSTYYKVNDIVRYGGRSYIANQSHTSAATAASGLEADQSKWDLMNDGIAFVGAWTNPYRYKVNDMVSYGGQIYICNTHHTSTGTFDNVKFSMFATGLQFEGVYSGGTTYQPGDVVTYGANSYVASQTTTGNLPTDPAYWTPITQGLVFRGTYNGATSYKKGDIVSYGPGSYVASQDTTGNLPSNGTYWSTLSAGLDYQSTYNGATAYVKGNIVQYGGYIYVAKGNTTGNAPTNATHWDLLAKGYTFSGNYNGATGYKPGEIVKYGGYFYYAKDDTTGNLPSNVTYWDVFSTGFTFVGDLIFGTTYKVGEIVKYGARLYLVVQEHASQYPPNVTFFTLFSDGVRFVGNYADATEYLPGDITTYGGTVYICVLKHTSNTAGNIEPPNATYWSTFARGMNWRGTWSGATEYEVNDVVEYLSSSWISISNDNLNNTPSTSPSNWNLVAQTGDVSATLTTAGDLLRKGSGGGLERIPVGTEGQILVSASGLPVWEDNNYTSKVFYVSPEGNNSNDGSSLNRAFATIAYAVTQVTGPATILVKSGTYTENLPITIPPSVAIVGDTLRTTLIQPQVGDETQTMFLMSDASILQKVVMQGLNGYNPGTPGDIDTSTVGGVFVALNPASPITTKSPYVLECSCFSTGGTGAVVNGSVHGSGFRSIVFHSYTMNNDDGVGIWVSNNGKAEVVSCFTYFCYYGYASSTGGQIRSLNGNNSYGRYGAISAGFDATETPITGILYGELITYELPTGTFNTGEIITSSTGTARVLSSQPSTFNVYIKVTAGTFSAGQIITGGTTGTTATIDTGGFTGQKGFIAVVSGLGSEPLPGSSLAITGDSTSYVIQTVTDFVSAPSGYKPAGFAILVLAQEKLTASAENSAITIRERYSKVRLTGHDFLNIGTGNKATTNYPGLPITPPAQGNEVIENFPGRVFYVSTDQDGNFRVGDFFRVDQATGKATLNANAFDLSGLSSLRLGSIGAQIGETINEFSSDATMSGNSNSAVPTEFAVKSYVDTNVTSLGVAYSIALGS